MVKNNLLRNKELAVVLLVAMVLFAWQALGPNALVPPGLRTSEAEAFTLTVESDTGSPVGGFRWLVQEDTTYPVDPGVPVSDSLGVNIMKYYSPPVTKGHSAGGPAVIALPDTTRYMVSVLPDAGFTMGGNLVALGQADVTVVVNEHPVPTAQISVYAFHDNQPINGAKDIPAEPPLPGFSVILHDLAGQVMFDAFGNMLGTEYQTNPDGSFIVDPDGNPIVESMGSGVLTTDAAGEVLIKYIVPGKYGVEVIPPAGQGWIQTASLEGSKVNDAWVRAGEPRFTTELGVLNWLVFFGFVKEMELPPTDPAGTITGQVVYVHTSHPPQASGINPGFPVPDAWVGLNNLSGADEQIFAAPCDADSNFVIENVPPGTYQLVMWDEAVDAVIDFRNIIVPPEGGLIDLGQVNVYAWYGNIEGTVFFDDGAGNPANAENGIQDAGEAGMNGQEVILRFPDGSVYQVTATDQLGEYSFNEVFPFFRFLVAEIDFGRFKATGATFVVDDGGAVVPGAKNNPQLQPENGGLPWRTETGPVLTAAIKTYSDQTNEIHWGKANYGPGENGGISGIVYYATTRAEDNPAYAAGEEWEPGIPNVQVNLYEDFDRDGVADGPAIDTGFTDSWDDNLPTDCVYSDPSYRPDVNGSPMVDCAESIRTYNQIRPGLFDGGYAFEGLADGTYIVEVIPPVGYELVKEEDKNVDFGDQFIPALLPPPCVGNDHPVPAELDLFPGIEAPYAGMMRPLCDRKQVTLHDGQNAAADFFLFTEVPVAGRLWGWVTDDLTLEFDPDSPNKGSNLSPSWLPVSFKDYRGNEVARVYADEWGKFNVMLPSTYTISAPTPTGVSPHMVMILPNDPGPIPDPMNPGQFITDPRHNPAYGLEFGESWEFYPGKTTHVDTIVVPKAAFVANRTPLDCHFPDGTPVISSVTGPAGGPYVGLTPSTITLTSLGTTTVPNPDYDPDDPMSETTIERDFSFGPDEGSVTVGGVPLTDLVWAVDGLTISATVPNGVTTGHLVVTRGDNGVSSEIGVTFHVGDSQVVTVSPGPGTPIQDAVDAAPDGALILVSPGVYPENVILWKPVKLQGAGAFSTVIDAFAFLQDVEGQADWEALFNSLVESGDIELVPGQQPDFAFERGAGITVATSQGRFNAGVPASIDGFGITGASEQGGGIFVNAYADYLKIGNNRLNSNQGSLGGGIRVGTPSLINATNDGFNSSENNNLMIHHNLITMNGSRFGSGGGIALYNGTNNYAITDNWICGNHAFVYGGGIAHFGLSDSGRIENNCIINNQSVDEGGGIMISGELVPAGAPEGTLTPGAGTVLINGNLLQGNLAGDDGGGIRTLLVNGQDVADSPSNPANWHAIAMTNNMIVNNSSADAGGGVSLDDTALVSIISNTIAHNDATSTGVDAFGGPCVEPDEIGSPVGQYCPEEAGTVGGITTSVPQVGGVQANVHSAGLQAAFGPGLAQEFSNPVLLNNIFWQNRSFYWDAEYNGNLGGIRPDVEMGEAPVFWDLQVTNTVGPEFMDPRFSIITDTTGYHPSNSSADPGFIDPYFNVYQATSKGAAFGNFVTVTFLPTGKRGDYHIMPSLSAANMGIRINKNSKLPLLLRYWLRRLAPRLRADIDGQSRPFAGGLDIGADEVHPAPVVAGSGAESAAEAKSSAAADSKSKSVASSQPERPEKAPPKFKIFEFLKQRL